MITARQIWTLVKDVVSSWVDDFAPSMGAALSYYTVFSLAPLLLIVIAIAGLVFGQEAAQGQILEQFRGLIGEEGAVAVQGLLKSASNPTSGIIATIVGVITLIIGATTVFGELQSDLDRIWRAPAAPVSGLWSLVRARLLSFGMVLGLGFLLLVSTILSAGVAALGKWWGGLFGGMEFLLTAVDFIVSFAVVTGLFAMIYKVLPRVKIDWHDVWIGAAVTALLFTVGKFLIGLYIGKSGVSSSFGAAGSLVALLLWVYYSSQIFLLGAEFTWVYTYELGSRAGTERPAAPAPTRQSRAQAAQQVAPTPAAPVAASGEVPASSAAITPIPEYRPPKRRPKLAQPPATTALGRAKEYAEANPIQSLGMIVSLGIVIGSLLRNFAPPEALLRRAPPRKPEPKLGLLARLWKKP